LWGPSGWVLLLRMSERPPCVVHVDDVPAAQQDRPPFVFARRQLSRAAGGRMLGCGHFELPPGATSFPMHAHTGNEEAFFVLEGEGVLRLPDQEVAVRAGDYVALPPGPEHAHQMRNEGDGPLRYLCFSTMVAPDVVLYPDSGKLGVFAGSPPGGNPKQAIVRKWIAGDPELDYLEGERGN